MEDAPMAERIYTTDERPRDTVVVRDADDRAPRSNTGVIIAVIIVILIVLFLIFGLPFGKSSSGGGSGTNSGGGTNINVQPSAPSTAK